MTSKRRLGDPAKKIAKAPEPEEHGLVANPAHGTKGDFVKVTATLSPKVYELIMHEVMRRKLAKERDAQLSAVIREAVVAMFSGRQPNASGLGNFPRGSNKKTAP
jgi:hypothetical protein